MKDEKLRDMMRDAYKLLDAHEQTADNDAYWTSLYEDAKRFADKYQGEYHEYAVVQALAVTDLLEMKHTKKTALEYYGKKALAVHAKRGE